MSFDGEHTVPKLPILIVGFSGRAAAQCARRAGFAPIVIDYCADRDLLALCHSHHSLDDPNWTDWVAEIHPSMPILFTGGMENRTQDVYACVRHSRHYGCSVSQIGELRSIANWERWANQSKLGWPITWTPFDGIEALKTMTQRGDWLIKSIASAGGTGISEWNDRNAISNLERISLNPKFYVQRKMFGDPIGVSFLSSEHGSTVIGVARNLEDLSESFLPKYIYHGSIGPIQLQEDRLSSLQQFANLVAVETGVLGLWQADFLHDQNELTLLEINPRWSASMEILDAIFGIRLVALHCECIKRMIGRERWQTIDKTFTKLCSGTSATWMAKRIRYATNDFTVTSEKSNAWWSNRWTGEAGDTRDLKVLYADIPRIGTTLCAGHPILTSITIGKSLDEVRHRLDCTFVE